MAQEWWLGFFFRVQVCWVEDGCRSSRCADHLCLLGLSVHAGVFSLLDLSDHLRPIPWAIKTWDFCELFTLLSKLQTNLVDSGLGCRWLLRPKKSCKTICSICWRIGIYAVYYVRLWWSRMRLKFWQSRATGGWKTASLSDWQARLDLLFFMCQGFKKKMFWWSTVCYQHFHNSYWPGQFT